MQKTTIYTKREEIYKDLSIILGLALALVTIMTFVPVDYVTIVAPLLVVPIMLFAIYMWVKFTKSYKKQSDR